MADINISNLSSG